MGDLTEAIQHRLLPSPVTAHRSNGNPSPMAIKAESWAVAEKEAERIISQCQPTVVSEKKRRDVIDYVQRLIRGYLGCEVFPYGSVPLKTYLPDGDIDLTAFGGANEEEVLADDIVSVLEAEEQNRAAEFIIKDVQLVRAEVKLVKCIVQNIVVDISFNQIGGLCTLCFLEQVDRLIGKNHLFKRSIILIKAWCYYQSRILGAHHGLISTYALETLVLYIFHVFHSTLDGPLAVLYKFLDYFSNFDWETYCISLTGPVRISSLPDIIVETPENGCGDLLLGSDFLRYCSHMFAVPLRDADLNSKTFPQKFLNIVDPLKENNNLGRSVSKGNFCRIRSAFAYGARKLGQILTHRVVDIAEELCIFFSSALDRHGSGLRADVQNSIPRSALSVYASAYSILDAKMEAKPCQYNNGSVQDIVENDAVVEVGIAQNGRQTSFVDGVFLLEDEKRRDRNGFPGNRLTGKANDISTSSFGGLKISNDTPKISPNHEEIGSALHMKPHAPHLYFSKSRLSNQTAKNVDFDTNQSENLENKISSVMKDNVPSIICSKSNESDLSGDYDSYLTCLHYGRWWYKYVSSILVVTMPPPPPTSPFPGVSLWDPVLLPSQFKRNGFSHGNVNDFIQSSVVYPMNQMLISGVAVGSEEMTKHRGTGTYFPNPNRPPNGYRTSSVKGWNFGRARSSSTKGRFAEANMLEKSNVEQLPQSHFTVDQCLGSDIHQSYSQRLKQNLNANGYISQPEGIAEHGPAVRHMPLRTPNPVSSRQPRLASLNPQTTSHGSPGPNTQMPNHVPGSDRLMVQKSYHLKNEDDFPPLSS